LPRQHRKQARYRALAVGTRDRRDGRRCRPREQLDVTDDFGSGIDGLLQHGLAHRNARADDQARRAREDVWW
jgi:hypothetical protein